MSEWALVVSVISVVALALVTSAVVTWFSTRRSVAKKFEPKIVVTGGSASYGRIIVSDGTTILRPRPSQTPRYADLVLLKDNDDLAEVRPESIVRPGEHLRLQIRIAELRPATLLQNPTLFPDDLLPHEDVLLQVVVSSISLQVLPSRGASIPASAATTQLLLPRDGAASRPASPNDAEEFLVKVPVGIKNADLRVSYYYRDAIVQSQRAEFMVGGSACRLSVVTDFTTSKDFTTISRVPDRPRLSMMVNQSGPTHTIVLRAPGDGHPSEASAEVLSIARDPLLELEASLRHWLTINAPTTMDRRRNSLIDDLRKLAPIGWQLYAPLLTQAPRLLADLNRPEGARPTVHIARSNTCDLTLPWSFLYDITLSQRYIDNPSLLPLCPVVEKWNGVQDLVQPEMRDCPEHGKDAENILCPFGFWGIKHKTEVLSTSAEAIRTIDVPEPSLFGVAKTRIGIDEDRLTAHLSELEGLIDASFGRAEFQVADSVDGIRKMPAEALPLLYLYCHGQATDAGTVLAVGRNEAFSPIELVGWVNTALNTGRFPFWSKPAPLVFINACSALEVGPKQFLGYLDALIGAAQCAGVIGTEVRVNQDLAMKFSLVFFAKLLKDGGTVGEAIHAARMAFLARGNLFGLVYTPYCWYDLTMG